MTRSMLKISVHGAHSIDIIESIRAMKQFILVSYISLVSDSIDKSRLNCMADKCDL